jgi:L-threonylcarbamoyladenylate synthase
MITEIGTDVEKAAAILKAGGLVAIPTETVYGLAANALNPIAVAKIFAAKNRPSFDPLIIHLAESRQVSEYVSGNVEKLLEIGNKFWPGPVTLLLPKRESIPDIVTSGLDKVAVRIPHHPLTHALLASPISESLRLCFAYHCSACLRSAGRKSRLYPGRWRGYGRGRINHSRYGRA